MFGSLVGGFSWRLNSLDNPPYCGLCSGREARYCAFREVTNVSNCCSSQVINLAVGLCLNE